MENVIVITIIAAVLCALIGTAVISIRIARLTRRKSAREAAIKAKLIAEVRAIHEEKKNKA